MKKPRPIDYVIMKEAGYILKEIFGFVTPMIVEGVRLQDIDYEVSLALESYGAKSGMKMLGFPNNLAISIDYEVIQGIPDSRVLKEGDIVSVDMTLFYEGVFVDKAVTQIINPCHYEKQYLKSTIDTCLSTALSSIQPNITSGRLGQIIQDVTSSLGLSVGYQFSGHTIGRQPHMEPLIPNYDDGSTAVISPGMFICIEPIIFYGSNYNINFEGSTITSNLLSAHAEETVYITEEGYEVIT
jgi:methionyl aminopeptidase